MSIRSENQLLGIWVADICWFHPATGPVKNYGSKSERVKQTVIRIECAT